MVSPFVISLTGGAGRNPGTTAGGVYAISTLGSVVGTLATGLWVIPRFGAVEGFKIVALAVAVPGVIGVVARYGWKGAASLLAPIAMCVIPVPVVGVGTRYVAPDGEEVIVEAAHDSAQGRIAVMRKGQYRLLLVDGIVQTGLPLDSSHLENGYCLRNHYFQGLIPYMTEDPASASALIIGLAGGLTASVLQQHGVQVDCVDLDPAIIEVARKWFRFSGDVAVADGRRYLENCEKRYDFCVVDTYSGDTFPSHMASEEAFQSSRGVLKPHGVLVVNFIGAPDGEAFACIYRTLERVFPHVRALKAEPGGDVQSLTVFASAAPIAFNGGRRAEPGDPTGVDAISETIERMTVVPVAGLGRILTDGHNPIELVRSEEALRWRQRAIEHLGEAAVF